MAIDTFKSIRDEVLSWLDEASDTDRVYTNVNYAINQAHAQRVTAEDWTFMRWLTPVTFSLVASQRRYSLHQEFARPMYFFNRTEKAYWIEVPPRSLEATQVRWNSDTDGSRYMFVEPSSVLVQPSSASTVNIVSSSISDTTAAKAITILGDTASGMTTESLVPSGTSAVTGTTQFTKILGVTKGAAWVGNLTLKAGTTTLLTLFPSEFGRSYPQIEILWLPTTTDTIEYRFYRQPRVLSADYDVPDIPPPFGKVLVWDTLLLMAAYDERINPSRVVLWQDRQGRLELQLRQTYLEGSTIAAEPRYIRYFGEDDPSVPRVSD